MMRIVGDPGPILVVEDDPNIRELMTEALASEGLRVLSAIDGEEACRIAETHELAAIVLDVGLPRLDGVEVAARIARMTTPVPIVVVTAGSRGADVAKIRPAVHIAKPFNVADLVRAVKQVVAPPAGAPEGGKVQTAES